MAASLSNLLVSGAACSTAWATSRRGLLHTRLLLAQVAGVIGAQARAFRRLLGLLGDLVLLRGGLLQGLGRGCQLLHVLGQLAPPGVGQCRVDLRGGPLDGLLGPLGRVAAIRLRAVHGPGSIRGRLLGLPQSLRYGLREGTVPRHLAQFLGDLRLLALGILGLVLGSGRGLLLLRLDLLHVALGGFQVADGLGQLVGFEGRTRRGRLLDLPGRPFEVFQDLILLGQCLARLSFKQLGRGFFGGLARLLEGLGSRGFFGLLAQLGQVALDRVLTLAQLLGILRREVRLAGRLADLLLPLSQFLDRPLDGATVLFQESLDALDGLEQGLQHADDDLLALGGLGELGLFHRADGGIQFRFHASRLDQPQPAGRLGAHLAAPVGHVLEHVLEPEEHLLDVPLVFGGRHNRRFPLQTASSPAATGWSAAPWSGAG